MKFKKESIDSFGKVCPHCGSSKKVLVDYENCGKYVSANYDCLDCEAGWDAVYSFMNIEGWDKEGKKASP